MKKSNTTNLQFSEKELEEMVTEFLRGDNWKKLAQKELKQTSKPDSEEKKDNSIHPTTK